MTEEKAEIVKKEEKHPDFYVKWGVTVFAILSWIVLIGLKFSSDISLKIPLIISIVLTIIGIFTFFAKKLSEKLKKEEDVSVPKPLTREQVEVILHKFIEEVKFDKIKNKDGILSCVTATKGSSQIYTFLVDLVYGEPHYVIINATYPDIMPTLVPFEKTKSPTLSKLENSKSQNPVDEPDMEISEEGVDNFGRPVRKTQRIIQKKKEEKKEETVI